MGAACCKPEVSDSLRQGNITSDYTPNKANVQAIDFDGEVNLFHFYLLRSVGKGAFGKVIQAPYLCLCRRLNQIGPGRTAQTY